MICLPVFCFDDVFVRYRIEGIMHAQAIENLSAEIAMEKFTGRYSFRQGNKPDALPDTTIAARGVHHGSGDRHNVHDGRFCQTSRTGPVGMAFMFWGSDWIGTEMAPGI